MFYADNFTDKSAKYVGFMDSDTLFHSYVDREDLFEDGKPIIHGRLTKLKRTGTDAMKRGWSDSTYRALGIKEPMVRLCPPMISTTELKCLVIILARQF